MFHHCQKFVRDSGYTTKKGDLIAITGKTGNADAPHLHLEVHRNAHITDKGVIDAKVS